MDTLVFPLYDITPEHWADFLKAVDFTTDQIGRTDSAILKSLPPYILVHSRSETVFTRTGALTRPVHPDFSNTTYTEMYHFLDTKYPSGPYPFFMVLDKQSEEDHKVLLISKGLRCLYDDEYEQAPKAADAPDDVIWRKHRVPFDKVAFFASVCAAKPGMEGDEFLQNTTLHTAEGL